MIQLKQIIKTGITFLIVCMTAFSASAQLDTVKVMTSAICAECKERIEHDMSFEKGVKHSVLDLDTKVLTVVYNPKKTNPEKIRIAVTKTGYDADSLRADPKAFNKLPDCCKKPGLMEGK